MKNRCNDLWYSDLQGYMTCYLFVTFVTLFVTFCNLFVT